jgi:hypothetical protein
MDNFHYLTSYEAMNIRYLERPNAHPGDIGYHPLEAGMIHRSLVWGMMPLGWIYLGHIWKDDESQSSYYDHWLVPVTNGYPLWLRIPRYLESTETTVELMVTPHPPHQTIWTKTVVDRNELDLALLEMHALVSDFEVMSVMLALHGLVPEQTLVLIYFPYRDRRRLTPLGIDHQDKWAAFMAPGKE